MKIIKSTLRAIVERVTEMEWHSEGAKIRLFIFEHLGQDGTPVAQWIQNWECDDVTDQFKYTERKEIFDALEEHYRSKSSTLI